MTRIAVIGGTGYAGRHIVAEAVRRGHTVVSVARSVPSERV
jgi:putative NADH-flavin reductase